MTGTELGALHALEVPTTAGSLLVPSACIAEVVPICPLVAQPLSPPWVLGIMAWRSRAVPVVSLEVMMGRAPTTDASLTDMKGGRRQRRGGKITVFYPLPARSPWEFFGVLASAEPQTRIVDGTVLTGAEASAGNALVAMTVRIDDSVFLIPDLGALSAMLYP